MFQRIETAHHRLGVKLALLAGLALSAGQVCAQTVSLAGVRNSSLPQALFDTGTVLTPGFYDVVQVEFGAAVASASTVNGAARAQTEYGINRVEAASFAAVDNEDLRRTSVGGPFADAISAWADRFVVQGGTGTGKLSVSAIVSGRFGNQPGGFGAYDLMVVNTGDAAADALTVAAVLRDESGPETNAAVSVLSLAQEVLGPGLTTESEAVAPGASFGRVLSGQIEFTYGRPFYLISVLGASSNDFGSLSAFNSARFGVSAPTGATLMADAGNYASAVPEPTSAALLLAACGLFASIRRSRRPAQSSAS